VYFEALEKYGISSVISMFKETKEYDKLMTFLKTHLIGCAKEINSKLFKELTQFLFVSYHNLSPDHFTLSQIELGKILHYKTEEASSVFGKTALNWANENNDRQCCGFGAGSGSIRTFLRDPDPNNFFESGAGRIRIQILFVKT